jgi:hypothetical protein
MARLEEHFNESSIRRSVEAVIIVSVSCARRIVVAERAKLTKQEHGFPHILTLQVANSYYKL